MMKRTIRACHLSLRERLVGQTVVLVLHRYCATRGLLFSHVGWIFFKPKYPKLHLIERNDLEDDPGLSTRRSGREVS